ncbi:ATP-binding protein [Caballeronia humi]|uniref:ATPase central domain-containing protein n=1 Tax=Caballeronia humi TaxID=326474 RepID=A0A158G8F5_9BURK|nr:ATP-binding protein [Caballeronia humi]SAL28143.1 ATPase central domain-containing protein [Caballeronia humi]
MAKANRPSVEPFAGSLDHLLAELERIDLLIRSRVAAFRACQPGDEQFRGLYVSEQQVDALLAAPLGKPAWLGTDATDAADAKARASLDTRLAELARRNAERKRLALEAGTGLRLERLRNLFGLDETDVDVLLVCLAVELDTRYEKLYAYLQDDVTRTRPSIDLVLTLLVPEPMQRIAERERFAAGAPLRAVHLLELFDDPARVSPPFIGKALKADARIVAFLLGSDRLDARVAPYVELHDGGPNLGALLLDDDTKRGLLGLLRNAAGADRKDASTGDAANDMRFVMHLQGPHGSGRRAVAGALCHERHQPLLAVDLERLVADGGTGLASSPQFELIDREARLAGAALYWNGFDTLLAAGRESELGACLRVVSGARGPSFLAGELPWFESGALGDARFIDVRLQRPSVPTRIELWQKAAAAQKVDAVQLDIVGVATKFRFTPGQIAESMHTAASLAAWRDPEHARIASQDLYDACRAHSNRTLSTLAQKITPRFNWNDIVLPADRLQQLREICNHIKYRNQVFNQWGFDAKLASSKGLSFLFAGPSGTGKTMAAGIIAAELGLDLYKIDLSLVISKFIGETEKNLGKIFDEAETANSILFFDEADSLFGKRSEVKDSHDRYANIEVGYLLQRIEEYEGIAILATNFRRNMDEAFVRRLQFTVDFPLPGEDDRFRMWSGILPQDAPRDPALDLALMAKRYTLTGGNIRNVALAAAFLAADDGDMIRMTHLIAATQREYQKMGKLVGDRDFEHTPASS